MNQRKSASIALVASVLLLTSQRDAEANIFSDAWNWVKGVVSPPPPGVRRTTRFRLAYTFQDDREKTFRGTFPAQGVRVGVFTKRNLLGSPEIQHAAETSSNGEVTLSYTIRPDEVVRIRIETDGPKVKTFPGKLNVFLSPHQLDIAFSAEESRNLASRELWWGTHDPAFNKVLAVHDAAYRSRAHGERLFAGVVSNVARKVDYSFPAWLHNGVSYCPLPDRVVIVDDDWNRGHTTIFHETGHTFWYAARGGFWNELLGWIGGMDFHSSHTLTEPAANNPLALSEGFANWYSLLAKDEFGRQNGRPDLANHQISWFGEDHRGRENPKVAFKSFGQKNETNVACALYDLADTNPDNLGLLPAFSDRSRTGTTSDTGARAVLAAIGRWSSRTSARPSFMDLFRADLRSTFGTAGEDALKMNGVRD